ncbi:carboxypeptidase-like regulatory domain-containing protein [Hymenobacter busanensis]|uniref:Carboxypeptidase-like regulatory domain-containing protein n=1 Tax=Hymenobacter busanensis TaxID=2607656 RepID=A0A7L4ZWT4_9BACT|nr:DUF5686 and carboxypeptidase regulatory-like domain-containing protein [Hymenobacter busanensis]KAA9325319.1 carboxypeptidase-like regulatory domain-containing protein [Hymenobacter busanensis]QHJ07688.1 carboxypeptidase-like regulatory domain-containing protein [Hymenobacter busanensis]
MLHATHRFLFLVFLFLLVGAAARAGVVRGRLTDGQGGPLSFANVAVKNAAQSTAANEAGQYQLKLPAGLHTLVFQYVGFRTRFETVRVAGGDTATVLDVALQAENYQLGEVVVRGSDRDPAYALVQHAINWRPYHQREVAAYQARTYLKSVFGLNEMPAKVLGITVDLNEKGTDPKVLYLEETITELRYQHPSPVQERMISTRVSGRRQDFGGSRAANQFNFYQNLQRVLVTTQSLVSPIADGAMQYYRYELVGTSQQAGLTLHKIRVTPRHAQTPAYTGFIYLVDGTWRLHSVALEVGKPLLKDSYESLLVEQQMMPAPGAPAVWVLQSQKLHMGFSFMGFKGQGTTQTVFLNYRNVAATYAARPAEKAVAVARPGRETLEEARQQRPELSTLTEQPVALLPADSAAPLRRGEVLRIEAGANERSAAYWDELRPVPLTAEEQRDYRSRDSIETRHSTRAYLDSVDHAHNQFGLGKLLLGHDFRNSFRHRSFRTEPLYQGLQYNTVEGVVLQAAGTFQQRYPDGRTVSLTPSLRYGAAARLLSPRLEGSYLYRPQHRTALSFGAGRTIADFNDRTQLTPLHNSLYTLLDGRNYAKLYQQDALWLDLATDLTPGLRLETTLRYADRQPLTNHTTATLRDVPNRAFTPNQPLAAELNPTAATGRSQALTLAADVNWQPGQRYITRPDRVVLLASRYPAFRLGLQQGLGGVLGSDVRFTRLEIGLSHTQSLGVLGRGQLSATAGTFVGTSRLQFMDYRHFAGNRAVLASDFGQFQLLDYYRFSTRKHFAEGHYQHFFQGLLLNKVPGLRRLKLQEIASVHYLYTPTLGAYAELGAGLQRDFLIGSVRADVVTTALPGFHQGRSTGVRLRIGRRF